MNVNRRRLLQGAALLGVASQARAGDDLAKNLPPNVPEWSRTLGAPILASPYGVLRRKLVLTLALLESAGATHAQYDSARPEPRARTLLSLALLGARWALVTLAAIVVLAPLHLAAGAGRLAGWRPSHEPSRG